jgi:hypothetical protein
VKQIFKLFIDGRSPRDIAAQLNADGIAAPHDGGKGHKTGRGWGFSTIRAMLVNERYIGRLTWNTHRWFKRGLNRKRRVREERPRSEWIVKDVPELAIIDRPTWERVQARIGQRRTTPAGSARPGITRAPLALSGLLKCGICGGTFGVVHTRKVDGETQRTLGCIAHKDRGDAICSNGQTIAERKVRRALAEHLRERMARPDRVAKFVAAFQAKFAQLEAKGSPTKDLQQKIDQQRQLVANILQAMITAPGSKALPRSCWRRRSSLPSWRRSFRPSRRLDPRCCPTPQPSPDTSRSWPTSSPAATCERPAMPCGRPWPRSAWSRRLRATG